MNELISVIIPTYQSSSTIRDCLESVLGQRNIRSEVIVVDDGSTDDTQQILAQFYDRIILHSILHRGAPAARNYGVQQAKGDYIFFCDSDVLLFSNTLEIFVKKLWKNLDCSFIYSGFYFGDRKMPAVPFSEYWLKRFNYISTMSLLKREDFQGFDENLKRFQDWDLWLTMVEQGKIGKHIPEMLFRTIKRKGISDNREIKKEAEQVIRIKHNLPIPNYWQYLQWKIKFWLYRHSEPEI